MREREIVEANLRASEERYRTLVETAPFPVVIIDLKGHEIVYMNPKASQVLDTEEGGGLKKPENYYEDLTEYARLVEILRRQGYVQEFEVCLKTESGKQVWASLSANITTYQNK